MNSRMPKRTRREFLVQACAASAVLTAPLSRVFAQDPVQGRFIGTVPLSRPGATRLEALLGSGLDARLFTNLSSLTRDSLVTSNERFYVRTACPAAVRSTEPWSIQVGGLVKRPMQVSVNELRSQTEPMGACLLECSGNGNPDNFGLMSAAEWRGSRLATLLARIETLGPATHVLVSGVDDSISPSGTSVPGASWIFTREQLEQAFLATEMNGGPLPRDHGAPVRLIVPGWYGCTCIKWVNQIDLVDDTAIATPHMREFAARTHQRGTPERARDFLPASIDHAAVPVRIEQWSVDGRLIYRVVGVLWGGDRPVNALAIRFGADGDYVPVDDCPLPKTTATWSLWTHTWRPRSPGRYEITLRIADTSVRTRRLDIGFYRRVVQIDQV